MYRLTSRISSRSRVWKAPARISVANERRFASAPNEDPASESEATHIDASAGTAAKKRQRILTTNNADKVLSPLDISKFHQAIYSKAEMTDGEIFALLKSCITDPGFVLSWTNHLPQLTFEWQIVPFSRVQDMHVDKLGLNLTYGLKLDSSLVGAANLPTSPANTFLNQSSMGYIRKHFNLTNESGTRCMINQFLVAAVIYAQTVLDQNEVVKTDIVKRFEIDDPHIAVFTDVPIPHTKVHLGNTSYTFHGIVDYGIGFISTMLKDALADGGVHFRPNKALSCIVEAKSLEEFRDAEPIITIQVLTIMTITKRKFFTGALTQGRLWRFFTAHDRGTTIRIYTSAVFTAEKDQGLIVELLKDTVLYPLSPMVITDLAKESSHIQTQMNVHNETRVED